MLEMHNQVIGILLHSEVLAGDHTKGVIAIYLLSNCSIISASYLLRTSSSDSSWREANPVGPRANELIDTRAVDSWT